MNTRTPVVLITGSLGSGKTTLLKRILDKPDRRIAVLMNEFGEIAIDSRVVQGENIDLVELAGGCVCCSMTGEFEAAIREIVDRADPEVIVVEATGLAESDALVYEIEDNIPEVRLDAVTCIVDAFASITYPQVGYTTRTQLTTADIILINKTDLVSKEEIAQVEAQVRVFNKTAAMFHTVRCEVDRELLFGPGMPGRHDRKPAGAPVEALKFQSFSFTTDNRFHEEKFQSFVETLPPAVFRSKGFIRFAGGEERLFNYVAGRSELEDFATDKTQIVFIGQGISGLREEILARLRECEV